jgi:hypothetical protein
MKRRLTVAAAVMAGLMGLTVPATAAIVVVDATENIFGAGHPAPPFNGAGTEGDLPTLALSGLSAGQVVTFNSVTGSTACTTTVGHPCLGPIGPDGADLTFSVGAQTGTDIDATAGTNVGISGIVFDGRQMFLAGVFIGDSEPTGLGPARLNYNTTDDPNALTVSPLLGQTFFVGDGRVGLDNPGGALQQFIVPVGGTRLFLGFLDSFDNFVGFPGAYTDNSGSLTVDVSSVPEPGTVVLMGLGFLGVALLRKKIA